MSCPICGSSKSKQLLRLNCGNFDQSILYRFVRIGVCLQCGHIYNQLSVQEMVDLIKYYETEYAQINIKSGDKSGDRPGSNSPNALNRYARLYDLINSYANKTDGVLDVGCAAGGFLDFLQKRGFKRRYGIDIIKTYVRQAQSKKAHYIKYGRVESLPFADNSMELLVMDQVLEHVVNLTDAFKEAKRVLANNGLLCISVPDAAKYKKWPFFDFYWFLLREHVQHFDLEHLQLLAEQEGFELVDYSKYETPMMSKKMILPILSVLFRSVDSAKARSKKANFKLEKQIKSYIAQESTATAKKKKKMAKLIKSQQSLYLWGMSRECLYLYENAGLKKCNIIGLIDNNKYKLQNYSLGGKMLQKESVLAQAQPETEIMITSFAHIDLLKDKIADSGYEIKVVNL